MGLKKNNPGCDCCDDLECDLCSDTVPETITLAASGWSNYGACSDCDDLNGSFILTWNEDPDWPDCHWKSADLHPCGGGTTYHYHAYLSSFLDGGVQYIYWWVVLFRVGGFANVVVYRTDAIEATSIDCEAEYTLERISGPDACTLSTPYPQWTIN